MKAMIVLAVAATAAIALIGCQSDAVRIREQNRTDAAAATATAAPTATATPQPTPTATQQPTATATPLRARIGVLDIEEGDCLDSQIPEGVDIESVVIVPCSGSWEYRTLNNLEAPERTLPEKDYFRRVAREQCDKRYTSILFPTRESWVSGDRTINCLQKSFGLSETDPAKLDRMVRLYSLATDDCFNEAPETDGFLVETVPCVGEWESRVASTFRIPSEGSFPSEEDFQRAAFERCDVRYTNYHYPTEEEWAWGITGVTCTQSSFGLSVTDPAKLDRLVDFNSLGASDCFNEAPETEGLLVESVPCDGEWESRVVSRFSIGSEESLPSDAYFQRAAFERCDARYSNYYSPSDYTWALGDRDVTCIQGSFGLSVTDPAKLDRLVDINSLGAGDCFNDAPETEGSLVETVPCDEVWQQQVVHAFSVDASGAYPGEDYLQDQAVSRCPEPWDLYYSPTESTWELGDRQITCTKKP